VDSSINFQHRFANGHCFSSNVHHVAGFVKKNKKKNPVEKITEQRGIQLMWCIVYWTAK